MGTIVQIDVCREDTGISKIKAAYNDVWERLATISQRMNAMDESGDIARFNNSELEPVLVSQDTYHVIEEAIRLSRLTKGAFDITVRPLMRLWRENERNNVLPTSDAIDKIRPAIGVKNIQLLANNRIMHLNPETEIDLGGIAKGYAVDEAARIFRQHAISRFYIDAGGDIYVGGTNCSNEPWRIGIRDPRDKSKIVDVVQLVDKAVTTSGDYEQYYVIQNQKWSHIINPITGYPQDGIVSSTVIAPNAMEADALATAISVLGQDRGAKYIDALGERYAGLIVTRRDSDAIVKYESKEYKKFKYKK